MIKKDVKYPLDVINERLISGYYNNLSPFTYSKDIATVCYLLGYCLKIDYNVVKARYEQVNSNKEYIRQSMIL